MLYLVVLIGGVCGVECGRDVIVGRLEEGVEVAAAVGAVVVGRHHAAPEN